MNEDIKILREALAQFDPKTHRPLDFSIHCTPDRIRRLLDDAERYQIWRNAYTSENPEQPATERILLNMANAWTAGDVDYFLDQARKA